MYYLGGQKAPQRDLFVGIEFSVAISIEKRHPNAHFWMSRQQKVDIDLQGVVMDDRMDHSSIRDLVSLYA